MGHRLRSWTAITSRDVLQIELWAGAVSSADASGSQRLFDDLLFSAYGDGDERARDVVQRIFRAVERRDPPEDDVLAADREIRDALADEIARGHLRVTAEPRPHVVPRPASDDLMPLSQGPEPPEPLPPPTTWFSLRVVDEIGDPIDGVEFEFDALGELKNVTTDGGGRARLDGMEGGSALANLRSTSRLRAKVQPRWATPRTPERAREHRRGAAGDRGARRSLRSGPPRSRDRDDLGDHAAVRLPRDRRDDVRFRPQLRAARGHRPARVDRPGAASRRRPARVDLRTHRRLGLGQAQQAPERTPGRSRLRRVHA